MRRVMLHTGPLWASAVPLAAQAPGQHRQLSPGTKRLPMMRNLLLFLAWTLLGLRAGAQTPAPVPTRLTWEQVRQRFEQNNPTLLASKLNVDESKAQEITAGLRPNPQFTFTADGLQLGPYAGHWVPLAGFVKSPGVSQLIERQHKRALRLESAQKATGIATSAQADLQRNLLFSLRGAFVQTLQADAVLRLANGNLTYFDHVLDVSRERYKVGDIAQVDLDRLELQRVQYESDVQTAEVNLRTAKIQLLMLLNDRTPVEQFDVTGPYDFPDKIAPLYEFRKLPLATPPNLQPDMQPFD